MYKLDEPLVVAWRRVLAIGVIDDLGQVAGQPLAFRLRSCCAPTTRKRLPRHWAKYANAAKVRFRHTQTA